MTDLLDGLFRSVRGAVLDGVPWKELFLFGYRGSERGVNAILVNLLLSLTRTAVWERRNLMMYNGLKPDLVRLCIARVKDCFSLSLAYCRAERRMADFRRIFLKNNIFVDLREEGLYFRL